MIYAKILNKNIYELDKFLDLSQLSFLEKRMALQISKNKRNISVGFSGPSDPRWRTWLDESKWLEVKNSLVELSKNLPNEVKSEWNQLTHDQQLYYTLLTTNSKSLNYGLTLRAIKQEVGGNSGKFHLKHLKSHTVDTAIKSDFNFIFDWVDKQQIFKEIGRCQIFINPEGNYTPIHRDYGDRSRFDQFIWMRFNNHKNFFVYDEETKEKHYVQGNVCIFDNYQWLMHSNEFHYHVVSYKDYVF